MPRTPEAPSPPAVTWPITARPVTDPVAVTLLREYMTDVADRYYRLHEGRDATPRGDRAGVAPEMPGDDLAPPQGCCWWPITTATRPGARGYGGGRPNRGEPTEDGHAADGSGTADGYTTDGRTAELKRVFLRPGKRGLGGGWRAARGHRERRGRAGRRTDRAGHPARSGRGAGAVRTPRLPGRTGVQRGAVRRGVDGQGPLCDGPVGSRGGSGAGRSASEPHSSRVSSSPAGQVGRPVRAPPVAQQFGERLLAGLGQLHGGLGARVGEDQSQPVAAGQARAPRPAGRRR